MISSGTSPSVGAGEIAYSQSIEQAGIRFTESLQRLRVVDADGQVVDDHFFVEQSGFSDFPTRLLRREDDTGLFLFRPGQQSVFPNGTYQLSLRFHRNNVEADPDSVVWRQAGDDEDEVARLLFALT